MHHIRYMLVEGKTADGKDYIEIATTRPETLLGDTAVAAHPEDERYKALVGKRVKLPLTDRTIPIIADAYVDREFGTGLVKITPGHDPNDFEVGKRHDLEQNQHPQPRRHVERRRSRQVPRPEGRRTPARPSSRISRRLGLYIEAEKPITHAVGHCYRCHTVVEPYLSEQWFVKMKPLADKALKAWRDGEIHFYPQRWENTYENWLTNVRDWCISRQLWWGHRIPVWYCAHCGKFVVAREEPLECPYCKSGELKQDEDVLDTWFSSWLWPFSTLGWPKDTADLRKFYPTTTLVTGFDIIFFWVSRMIMAGLEFTGQVPFRDICMTTLVRDKQGRKMSKSLGNGIDPLEIVDLYGADALKFTMAFLYHLDPGHPHRQGRLQARLQVLQQGLEREPLHPHEPRGPQPGREARVARRRPLDLRPPGRGIGRHARGPLDLPLQRRRGRGLRVLLERLLRLVRRGDEDLPALRRRRRSCGFRGREGQGRQRPHRRARGVPRPPPSPHPLRDRGDLPEIAGQEAGRDAHHQGLPLGRPPPTRPWTRASRPCESSFA